ncbi:MAG: hypothetical protein M3542_03915 [Acidobacteriota bacterium]|nr:hypothetical protein [Acidobacteriota bacterium]
MKRGIPLLALLASCALFAGCGDEKRLFTEPDAPPSELATFTRVQREVFTPKCALSGCHFGPSSAAQEGLVLTESVAYDTIVMVRSNQNTSLFRVAPFDPANSYLVRKITPGSIIVNDRMPQTGELTDAERRLVTDWVARGAPRD